MEIGEEVAARGYAREAPGGLVGAVPEWIAAADFAAVVEDDEERWSVLRARRDLMATIGTEPSVNGHNSNRKRVLAPPVDGPQLVKKPSNLHNKPSMSNNSDLQVSNKNYVSDKNKETMVHNDGSARQLEKCFAGHKNVVRNQEAFDHSYTAQQGETNFATHKNKETLLQNVRTQQGEKTFGANKVNKKTTKGATASSKSAESGSLSWLGASELPIKKING
ncbi:hypothetical protein ZWY2020_026170 [Hordeum vulgare]|nr:hypothetical protein ZWY2020_026170 [Hordeum vulgare]